MREIGRQHLVTPLLEPRLVAPGATLAALVESTRCRRAEPSRRAPDEVPGCPWYPAWCGAPVRRPARRPPEAGAVGGRPQAGLSTGLPELHVPIADVRRVGRDLVGAEVIDDGLTAVEGPRARTTESRMRWPPGSPSKSRSPPTASPRGITCRASHRRSARRRLPAPPPSRSWPRANRCRGRHAVTAEHVGGAAFRPPDASTPCPAHYCGLCRRPRHRSCVASKLAEGVQRRTSVGQHVETPSCGGQQAHADGSRDRTQHSMAAERPGAVHGGGVALAASPPARSTT
jgi:hypothetical protein